MADHCSIEPLILTPLLEAAKFQEARGLARIGPIGGDLELESYSGFITVNKTHGSNMFFWYFPSCNNAETDPLILVVDGGPGVSVFLTMFMTVLSECEGKLKIQENNWAANSSVLFVDAYMGAGYSYTNSEEGYDTNSNSVAANVYTFLGQFFKLFPQQLKNKMFLTGGSYGAHIGPPIARLINTKNEERSGPKINLQKVLLYVPWSDPPNQVAYASYYRSMNVVGTTETENMSSEEEHVKNCISKEQYAEAFQHWMGLTSTTKQSGFIQPMNVLNPKQNVFGYGFVGLAETPQFREAIHVGKTPFGGVINFAVLGRMTNDFMQSVKPDIEALLAARIPIYLIAGQFDLTITPEGVDNLVQNLRWPGRSEFDKAERKIWTVEENIAGYRRDGGNLTHVLMRNAGHLLLEDQPEWALAILKEAMQTN